MVVDAQVGVVVDAQVVVVVDAQVVVVVVQVAEEDHAEFQRVFEWITIGKEYRNSLILSERKGSSGFLRIFL